MGTSAHINKDSLKESNGIVIVLEDTSIAYVNPKLKFNYSLLFPDAESILFDTSYTSDGNEVHDIIPLYSDDLIEKRLNSLNSEIKVVYNKKVQQWINIYTQRNRFKAKQIMGKKAYFFPFFEHELEKAGLPKELKYISIIESALDPYALSPSGAMGLWQFIRSTALYHLDMEITPIRDERRCHYGSTKNAVKYFKELHNTFGDWLLAIAAYNGGPGTLRKAIKKSGGKKDFFSILPYLPKETQNYVPAFIAVMYLDNYAKAHYISPERPEKYHAFLHPDKIEPIELKGPLSFKTISKHIGIAFEKLIFLNPDYNIPYIPENTKMKLVLPKEKAIIALAENDNMRVLEKTDKNNIESYVVEKGDFLHSIAQKNNCSIRDLKSWNGLRSNIIHPGQVLNIFNHSFYQSNYYTSNQNDRRGHHIEKDGYIFYTIKGGDTLYKIAKRFKASSVEEIKKNNKIGNVRSLVPGAVIKIQKVTG